MNNVIWKISIITTTPDLFPGPLQYSNVGKSLADGKWSLEIIPLEKRQNNKKVKIDGSPAGGGPGMIMRADIVLQSLIICDKMVIQGINCAGGKRY